MARVNALQLASTKLEGALEVLRAQTKLEGVGRARTSGAAHTAVAAETKLEEAPAAETKLEEAQRKKTAGVQPKAFRCRQRQTQHH